MLTEARTDAVGREQDSPDNDTARALTELSDARKRGQPLSSASKTLALLAALGTHGRSFGVTEVAMDIGVPKSTAHRLLKTLEEHRFVARTGSRYRAGARLFELSEVARWSEYGELRDAAYRPLNWLFERSGAIAVHLAVLRDQDVMYLDKITSPEGTRLPSRVGGRFPATCTALGKAILAFSATAVVEQVLGAPLARATPFSVTARPQLMDQLDQARSATFAVEREEACQGAGCVAAPVLRNAEAIAAVSLSMPAVGSRAGRDQNLPYGKLAAEAAAAVADMLPTD
jgi:IclR family transcriptional regulator, acetate operon repressor